MIFVTLGTQDKSFERLLKAIDSEIKKGNIDQKVIVQAGHTVYQSKNMQIFDYVSMDDFTNYINNCDILITHGGVGSIIDGIKRNKKIIAVPRLAKYKEHTNDHQLEIVEEFENNGNIIALYDTADLDKALKKIKAFKPKRFKSNTSNMIKLLNDFIKNN